MTAKQDFNGPVSTAIQADVVHLNRNDRGRLLTRDERREVNARVQKLAEDFGDEPWVTWRLIHRAIGIESVEQITIEHRGQVDIMLDLLAERGGLKRQLAEKKPVIPASPQVVTKVVSLPCPTCSDAGSMSEAQVKPKRSGIVRAILIGIVIGAMVF